MNVVHRTGVPWPAHKKRCADRIPSKFRNGNTPQAKEPNIGDAAQRVEKQISTFSRSTWRTKQLDICADVHTGVQGGFLSNRGWRDDPGAVVSFDLDGKNFTIACDRYDTPSGNLCAIAAHIEGLRAQERHGVATIEEMLGAHAALPEPMGRGWWIVLELSPDATREQIDAKYRELAKKLHPDTGGSHEEMTELNAAYEQAKDLK